MCSSFDKLQNIGPKGDKLYQGYCLRRTPAGYKCFKMGKESKTYENYNDITEAIERNKVKWI